MASLSSALATQRGPQYRSEAESFMLNLPVEVASIVFLYLEYPAICVTLISLSAKIWRKKAFSLLNELQIDKLDAWRLRDAPFDFQRIESLHLKGYRLSLDWALERYPVRRNGQIEKSSWSTKADIEGAQVLLHWAPKLGNRLKRLHIQGPQDYRLSVSVRVLQSVSDSPAADSLIELTVDVATETTFSPYLKFDNLTHLKLFRISVSVSPVSLLDELAQGFPSLRYLLLDLSASDKSSHIVSSERGACFERLKLFKKLETFAYFDYTLSYSLSRPEGAEMKWFFQKHLVHLPPSIELRIANMERGTPTFVETLPAVGWILGWDLGFIKSLEETYPPTKQKPRANSLLMRRLSPSVTQTHVTEAVISSVLDLWFSLPYTESFASVSGKGQSVLTTALQSCPREVVKVLANRTLKDLDPSSEFFLIGRQWSQLSSLQKAEDRATLLASNNSNSASRASVVAYVASDDFHPALRAFVNLTASIEPLYLEYGSIVTSICFRYDVPCLVALLKAGLPPVPFEIRKTDYIIHHTTLLEHELNLHAIQLLWPALEPDHLTQDFLSASLQRVVEVAGNSWKRMIPNLTGIIQFFLTHGATIPATLKFMLACTRCSYVIDLDLFDRIAEVNVGSLSQADWITVRNAALSDWSVGYGFDRLHVLMKYYEKTPLGLSSAFQRHWEGELPRTYALLEFLLDRGADPSAKDSEGIPAIHHFSVCYMGEYKLSEERDPKGYMSRIANLFTKLGIDIPEPSDEAAKYIQRVIEQDQQFAEYDY